MAVYTVTATEMQNSWYWTLNMLQCEWGGFSLQARMRSSYTWDIQYQVPNVLQCDLEQLLTSREMPFSFCMECTVRVTERVTMWFGARLWSNFAYNVPYWVPNVLQCKLMQFVSSSINQAQSCWEKYWVMNVLQCDFEWFTAPSRNTVYFCMKYKTGYRFSSPTA